MRVGSGDFIYEFIPNWGILPEGYEFGGVPDGAVDAEGRVFVFSRSDHPIMVFDADGNFFESWGKKEFGRPHGAFMGPDAFYCVYDGEHLGTITHAGPPFNRPTSLALAPMTPSAVINHRTIPAYTS